MECAGRTQRRRRFGLSGGTGPASQSGVALRLLPHSNVAAFVTIMAPAEHSLAQFQSRITLPDWPESATWKAASNWLKGKRWVMTGRMSRPLSSITDILYQVSYISRP